MPSLSSLDEKILLHSARIYEGPSDWTWHTPQRSYFNLWILLEGEGVFECGQKTHPLLPGAAFLVQPEEEVRAWSTGTRRLVNFSAHFSPGSPQSRANPRFFAPLAAPQTANTDWVAPLCRQLSELFYLDPKGGASFLIQGLGLLLLGLRTLGPHRQLAPPERKILEIIERVRRNPAAAYSVSEMAHELALSPSQFTRRFRAFTGRTPGDFVIHERLARAESYLQETSYTIETIAERLGYRDVYFFSRQFRKFRGVSPSRFRAMPRLAPPSHR